MHSGVTFQYYTKFNIKDYTTYLAPFIRTFERVYCFLAKKKYSHYSHTGLFLQYQGELWVYEAIENGFKRSMKAKDYIIKNKPENFLILTPSFSFSNDHICAEANRLVDLNLKYDFIGLLPEALYLSTDERVWLGKNKVGKRVFCTGITGYLYNASTRYPYFEKPFSLHPSDFYDSDLFEKSYLV